MLFLKSIINKFYASFISSRVFNSWISRLWILHSNVFCRFCFYRIFSLDFAVIAALRWISLFHWKVLSFYANWYAHVHFDFEVHISLIMDGHGHICSKTHSNQIIFALHSILALLHSFTTFLAAVTELGIYEWFLLMNLITRTCREEIALIMRLWTRLEGWELLKLG